MSPGEVGRLLAAARSGQVLVRHGDALSRYWRRTREDPAGFAARLGRAQVQVSGDLPAPAEAQVYALYPYALDPANVHLLSGADMVAMLAPASR